MAADTSIEAYHKIGFKEAQRDVILALLSKGPASMHAIEKRTGIKRSSVCGRMGELRDAGLIRKAYKDKDAETGMTVQLWEVVL
jgi:DNA-binding MarR family transcriptional regulator